MRKYTLLLGCCFISFIAIYSQDKQPENYIEEKNIVTHIKKLASDDFLGRKPGTKGEELTTRYIASQLKLLNIKPGNKRSYFQEFTIKEIVFSNSSSLSIHSKNGNKKYALTKDFYARTNSNLDRDVHISNTDMIFVGFGIVASRFKWDDYKNIDVKGKIVVVLDKDPGVYIKDPKLFNGVNPSYYGSIKYKKREAVKRGAIGVLVVQPNNRNWQEISNGKNPIFPEGLPKLAYDGLKFSGYISKVLMNDLLSNSGQSFDYIQEATTNSFKPISLQSKATLTLRSTSKDLFKTKNVVGIIKGAKRPKEYIIYTAHWDHVGTRAGHLGKDSIFNGAVDNASGTAMQLEVARAFMTMKKKPERSIIFLFTSAEEMGLLGAEYYANHPLYPIQKTACVINSDASFPVEKMRMVINVINGFTEMDTIVSNAATKIGRGIYKSNPNTPPPGNVFQRSDHFPFVKKGVPAVWNVGNFDPINGDEKEVAKIGEFIRKHYHKVTDEFYEGFNVSNIAYDAQLNFLTGLEIANSKDWPNWKENTYYSQYKTIRDKSRSSKK